MDDGHDVTIVTSDDTDARSWRREDRDGLSTVFIPTRMPRIWRRLPILRHYARSWNHRRYSRDLDAWLTGLGPEDRPDVIEFAEVGGEGYFYTLRAQRQPVVVRCHTPTFILRKHHHGGEMKYDTGVVERMEKACIRSADVLTTPSADMARVVAAETGVPLDRFHPVANAVDVTSVHEASGTEALDGLPDGAVVVLHVGRLERVKGIGILAETIPDVVKTCPNAYFVFIGQPRADEDGRMWDERLRDTFDQAGVGERTRLLNYVETPVMNRWYQRADLAVVPSLNYESFSYTCAQAMAAGLPVVATAIGGIPETLDRGACGLLVEASDVVGYRNALVTLINDAERRVEMGRLGLERARTVFAAPVVAERMVALYRKAIEARG
jgi:spore coat protein SA